MRITIELDTNVDSAEAIAHIAALLGETYDENGEPVVVTAKPKATRKAKSTAVKSPLPATNGVVSGPTDLAGALDVAPPAPPPAQLDLVTLVEETVKAEEAEVIAEIDLLAADVAAAEATVTAAVTAAAVAIQEPAAAAPVVDEAKALADAAAEIRSLVIELKGQWLAGVLSHFKAAKISALTLPQALDAVRQGRELLAKPAEDMLG